MFYTTISHQEMCASSRHDEMIIRIPIVKNLVASYFDKVNTSCRHDSCSVKTNISVVSIHHLICLQRPIFCNKQNMRLNNCDPQFGLSKFFKHLFLKRCAWILFEDRLREYRKVEVSSAHSMFHARINDLMIGSILHASSDHDYYLRPMLMVDGTTLASGIGQVNIVRKNRGDWMIYVSIHADRTIADYWTVKILIYNEEKPDVVNFTHDTMPAHFGMTENEVIKSNRALILSDSNVDTLRQLYEPAERNPLFDLQIEVKINEKLIRTISMCNSVSVTLTPKITKYVVSELRRGSSPTWFDV